MSAAGRGFDTVDRRPSTPSSSSRSPDSRSIDGVAVDRNGREKTYRIIRGGHPPPSPRSILKPTTPTDVDSATLSPGSADSYTTRMVTPPSSRASGDYPRPVNDDVTFSPPTRTKSVKIRDGRRSSGSSSEGANTSRRRTGSASHRRTDSALSGTSKGKGKEPAHSTSFRREAEAVRDAVESRAYKSGEEDRRQAEIEMERIANTERKANRLSAQFAAEDRAAEAQTRAQQEADSRRREADIRREYNEKTRDAEAHQQRRTKEAEAEARLLGVLNEQSVKRDGKKYHEEAALERRLEEHRRKVQSEVIEMQRQQSETGRRRDAEDYWERVSSVGGSSITGGMSPMSARSNLVTSPSYPAARSRNDNARVTSTVTVTPGVSSRGVTIHNYRPSSRTGSAAGSVLEHGSNVLEGERRRARTGDSTTMASLSLDSDDEEDAAHDGDWTRSGNGRYQSRGDYHR